MEKYKINLNRLGMKIFAIRKKNGLSMEAMAQRVGVSNGAINRYEKGRMLPRIETLKNIIAISNDVSMTPDEFIYGSLDNYLTEIFDGVRDTLPSKSKPDYDLLIEKLKKSIQENQLPWSSQFMIVSQLYEVGKTNNITKAMLESCEGYVELRSIYNLPAIEIAIEKDINYRANFLPLLNKLSDKTEQEKKEILAKLKELIN